MRVRGSRGTLLRSLAALLLVALFAAACGGDDGESSSGTVDNGSPTTEAAGDPVAGGSSTLLLFSEVGSLDPRTMAGSSAAASGLRGFALYGALALYDNETGVAEPVLAESFEPSADYLTWTLKLKPGITFTDGTPYDAEAVKVNWESAKDISRRSPSLTMLLQTSEFVVTDATTLTVTLTAPNAHFDKAVAQSGMTFIASAKAITENKDLTSEAVGAGPFVLESWLRDDRMVMKKNPDWKGSEGPYLDELIFRVVGDEDQRIDTFTTGQADGFYTATPASATRATDSVDGAEYISVPQAAGQTYAFNTSKAPFDDVRVRKAFVQGVDWQALADTVFGEGAVASTNYSLEGSPWYTEDAALPSFDPDAAQQLIDEYLAEKSLTSLDLDLLAFQQSLDQARAKFIQTSLSQLDNVKIDIEVNDSPTNIGKVLAGDYMVSSWGIPHFDPEPRMTTVLSSTSFSNFAKYENPELDALLTAGRSSSDEAERTEAYTEMYKLLALELPYYPYVETVNGFVLSPEVHGGKLQEDGILRFDLLWKSS